MTKVFEIGYDCVDDSFDAVPEENLFMMEVRRGSITKLADQKIFSSERLAIETAKKRAELAYSNETVTVERFDYFRDIFVKVFSQKGKQPWTWPKTA